MTLQSQRERPEPQHDPEPVDPGRDDGEQPRDPDESEVE